MLIDKSPNREQTVPILDQKSRRRCVGGRRHRTDTDAGDGGEHRKFRHAIKPGIGQVMLATMNLARYRSQALAYLTHLSVRRCCAITLPSQ